MSLFVLADDVDPDLQLAIERSMMEMVDAPSRRESNCSEIVSSEHHEAAAPASRGTTTVVDPYVLSSYFKKVVDKDCSIANENLCSIGADDDDLSEATALAKAEAEASSKVHKILLKSISGGGAASHSESDTHSRGEIPVATALEIGDDEEQDETEMAIDAGNDELDAMEMGDIDGPVSDQKTESSVEEASRS